MFVEISAFIRKSTTDFINRPFRALQAKLGVTTMSTVWARGVPALLKAGSSEGRENEGLNKGGGKKRGVYG